MSDLNGQQVAEMAAGGGGVDILKLASEFLGDGVLSANDDQRWQLEPLANYYGLAATAKERGKPVVWTSVVSKPEIFWAMDIVPVAIENLDNVLTTMPGDRHHKYIDIAEEHMVADHLCSLNKTMIGMGLSGDIPRPAAIVHPGQPCDSIRVSYSAIAEILDVPAFTIDVPLWRNERAYIYIADELERMVDFLEEKMGRKLEYDRLKQVMELSNRAHDYAQKINELKKRVPSPIGNKLYPPLSILAGTGQCLDFAEKAYELGSARAEKGESFLPKEKIRLGWFSTGVLHDPGLTNWLEDEFGCIVLNSMGAVHAGPINDLSSVRKIFEGLAEQLMQMPMTRECGGIAEDWLNHAIPVCRDFKIDAVFLTLNLGCKNAWALAKLLKDEIADKIGIPTLVLEVDVMDGRVVSGASIRKAMADFFATMLG